MIETKVKKVMEISHGKEENEVLNKAASILMDILDACDREGFSNGLINNSSGTIDTDISVIEDTAHILEDLANSYIFTIKI